MLHSMCLLSVTSLLVLSGSAMCVSAYGAEPDNRLYEMRVYYAPEGKLEALHARFRDHTIKLFEKHGIENIGYFVPVENPERKLIYFLAYANREAREKSWKSFMADPVWQAAYKASEVDGKLVSKVDTLFLKATDFSPSIKAVRKPDRVFEMRTYTTTEGNLSALNARFRDHTCKLFEKYGMTNVAYWTPASDQKGAENTLLYLLSHASQEAAKASFDAFRKDPVWIAARKASEDKAGGSLTVPDGVVSLFLQATDYSPMQ